MSEDATKEIAVTVDGQRLTLSRLDKVLYPESGTTKAEIIDYYARVHPLLSQQLADRPVTRRRWPDGVASTTTFFEKNLPQGAPPWVRRATLPTPGSSRQRDTLTFPIVDSLATLTWMANLAVLELHTPQWRIDSENHPMLPDRLVIDLDPGAPAGLAECAEVALQLRERMARDGLDAYPVTSGSKGMQLYAAIAGTQDSATVSGYAKALAEETARATKGLVVATMTKSVRAGKVFLDFSQNAAAKTTITPFSLRGKELPHVAAPRSWDELDRPERLTHLTFHEVLERLDSHQPPDPRLKGPQLPSVR